MLKALVKRPGTLIIASDGRGFHSSTSLLNLSRFLPLNSTETPIASLRKCSHEAEKWRSVSVRPCGAA
jgi:hypothetical protein